MNFKKLKSEKGITLIALIITIIVLLILAGVSIITLTGENGTITRVQTAKKQSKKGKLEEEVKLAITNLQIEENQREMTQEEKREELEKELKKQDSNSTVSIDGSGFIASHGGYNFNISDNYKVSIKEPFNAEEWDKTAADDDCFYWGSNDPNSEDYGKVIGYTKKIEIYTVLRFPSRCTKISFCIAGEYEDGVTVSESRSFTNNIKKVEIPGTVNSIEDQAFGGPVANTFQELKEVTIEEGMHEIIGFAFRHCTNLSSITIPNSVISIGGGALDDTQWYKNQPDGLVYAGRIAYKYKGNMPSNTNIEIKSGTTEIASDCFENCTNLNSIAIPNSVTSIGWAAFGGCVNLNSIMIPNNIKKIDRQVFNRCSSLTSVIYKGITYTSKASLVQALEDNGVTGVEDLTFGSTGLSD